MSWLHTRNECFFLFLSGRWIFKYQHVKPQDLDLHTLLLLSFLVFINLSFDRGVVSFVLLWFFYFVHHCWLSYFKFLTFIFCDLWRKKNGCFSQNCLNNSIYNITFNMLKRDIKMYWRQQRVRQLIWYECKLNGLILCKIQFKYLSYDRYDSRFHDNIMNFSKVYWNILHHISLSQLLLLFDTRFLNNYSSKYSL